MMNTEQAQEIRVISESFVRPKHEVEAAKQPYYYLGPIDLSMMSIDPIQKGLLFTPENRDQISTLLERLENSMSIALIHFYPLAGRFATEKYEDEHACLIYVDCNKGPGARLIHASMDLKVSDILSPTDVPSAVRSFFDLGEKVVNHDFHTKPILSIQVTELIDGVFIGFTISHCVVDGTSFCHFINVLSQIFRCSDSEDALPVSRVPIYKQYCPDGYGPIFKLPYLEPDEFIIRYDPGQLRERIFHFSPASMAKLKTKANEETDSKNITSFLALTALVWRSITRARGLSVHEETNCDLLVNARNRLEPPLSESHFGNFVAASKGICKLNDLLGSNLGSVAMILRQEVDKCTHKHICDFLKFLSEKPIVAPPGSANSQFHGPNNVVIGGSARFDMYGPEFGWGRAVAVRMGFANKDNGKVTANPGREGGGSVDLEICLKPEIMSALEVDEEFMYFAS